MPKIPESYLNVPVFVHLKRPIHVVEAKGQQALPGFGKDKVWCLTEVREEGNLIPVDFLPYAKIAATGCDEFDYEITWLAPSVTGLLPVSTIVHHDDIMGVTRIVSPPELPSLILP